MRKTNFDQSSTGVNIEAACFYDTDRSRMEFESNFKMLQHSSYYKNAVAYYIDNGNVEDDSGITFTLAGTEEQIDAALTAQGYDREEIKAMIPGEPLSILETLYGEHLTILNYEDFNQVYAPLQVIPSKALVKVSIHGYSQGDYAEVFYCPDDLRAAWGTEPDKDSLQEMFARLFYDAPIYASVTINGTDYSYYDAPEYSDYEWKREEFIAYIVKESGIDKAALEDLIPQDPSYN